MKEYIEREALLAIYEHWLPQLESEEDKGDRNGVETCIAVLKTQPAADVVERKRGEWRIAARDMSTHTVLVECSECCALLDIPMTAFGLNYDFCPNCGADMRGEKHEP